MITGTGTSKIRGILFDVGDTLLPATILQTSTLTETAHDLARTDDFPDPASFIKTYQAVDAEPTFDTLPDLNHLYGDSRIVFKTLELLGKAPTEKKVTL